MPSRRRTPRRPADPLARARQKRAEQESWEQVVTEAATLHGFEYTLEGWPALSAWYATVPITPPRPTEQERWLREQRVLASWSVMEQAS